ncbi:UNVERIFIED_CONTAM: hypothetical protein K2H54_051155 [Gekko kuhli]
MNVLPNPRIGMLCSRETHLGQRMQPSTVSRTWQGPQPHFCRKTFSPASLILHCVYMEDVGEAMLTWPAQRLPHCLRGVVVLAAVQRCACPSLPLSSPTHANALAHYQAFLKAVLRAAFAASVCLHLLSFRSGTGCLGKSPCTASQA